MEYSKLLVGTDLYFKIRRQINTLDFGLFGGYSMNMGTQEELLYKENNSFVYYGRNPNIDNLIRVSPRIMYTSGKTRFAFETEYTKAAYGTLKSDGTSREYKRLCKFKIFTRCLYFLLNN